jgi:hypothetical protein
MSDQDFLDAVQELFDDADAWDDMARRHYKCPTGEEHLLMAEAVIFDLKQTQTGYVDDKKQFKVIHYD